MRNLFCTIIVIISSVSAFAGEEPVSVVDSGIIDRIALLNEDIAAAGKRWRAGVTSKSALSRDELEAMFPVKELIRAVPGVSDVSALQKSASADGDIPDWKAYMSAVEDQGAYGTCWAHAATDVIEAVIHKRIGANVGIDLDEWEVATNASCGDEVYGASDPACGFGYVYANKARSEQSLNVYPNYDNAYWGISNYASGTVSEAGIKATLANSPVLARMYLYEDFLDYESGIYEHVSGDCIGAHDVVIIDYDDDDGFWICKNSFGTGWGEDGYFKIAYGECSINSSFNYSATVSSNACYAKIVPSLVADLDDAMSYSWATGEHGYFRSTYTLDATEDIDSGTTMELLPGATVKVPLDASLQVYGTLAGGGTSASRATVTSSLGSPYAGSWYAVRNYGTVDLEYTDLMYSGNGVKTYSGAVKTELDYCTVGTFKYYGVRGTSGTLTVRNCTIENGTYATARGIYASSGASSVLVDDNVIRYLTGASATGIYLYGAAYAAVTDNNVYNSSGRMERGIYIRSADGVSVLRNDVSDCAVAGIDCYDGADVEIDGNTVSDCDVTTAAGIAVHGAGADDVLVMNNHVKAVNGNYSAQYGLYCYGSGHMIARMNTVEDFNHSGVYAAADHGGTDCGATIYDRGNNNIAWNVTGTAVATGSYYINNAGSAVSAIYNYYGTTSPSSAYFNGSVTWSPYLTSAYSAKPVRPGEPAVTAGIPDATWITAYPNPMTSMGTVRYRVEARQGAVLPVAVAVYDRSGARVTVLDGGLRAAGVYQVCWNSCSVAGVRVNPGLYYAVALINGKSYRTSLIVK